MASPTWRNVTLNNQAHVAPHSSVHLRIVDVACHPSFNVHPHWQPVISEPVVDLFHKSLVVPLVREHDVRWHFYLLSTQVYLRIKSCRDEVFSLLSTNQHGHKQSQFLSSLFTQVCCSGYICCLVTVAAYTSGTTHDGCWDLQEQWHH